jgi:hypothetical protein
MLQRASDEEGYFCNYVSNGKIYFNLEYQELGEVSLKQQEGVSKL